MYRIVQLQTYNLKSVNNCTIRNHSSFKMVGKGGVRRVEGEEREKREKVRIDRGGGESGEGKGGGRGESRTERRND